MILPFDPQELFEIGDFQISSFQNDVLIIDDWYKNFDQINKVLTNISVPIYIRSKYNFIEYYDCRHTIECGVNNYKGMFSSIIIPLVKKYFRDSNNLKSKGTPFKFNYFKNLVLPANNNMQHLPHRDLSYNCIIYLDTISSGGTNLYPDLQASEVSDHDFSLYDISNQKKIVQIQAKPNRMAIFKGNIFHGGYIKDHSAYLNHWRINQIIFLDIDTSIK